MRKILLTTLAWITKIPASTINDIYDSAESITQKNDADETISGWEKLKISVSYLVKSMPEKYSQIGGIVVTIIVNVAVLVVRLRELKK